jgi:hypothetical protein
MAALMTSEMDKTENVVKFTHETSQMGIKVIPPDINESNYSFTVVGNDIRFGLGAVKGVGESAIESILEARRRLGRFTSLLQFCEEVDLRACNKKVLEALVKSGSFDFLKLPRKALFEQLEPAADGAQRTKEAKEMGQSSLFGFGGGQSILPVEGQARSPVLQPTTEWPDEEKLRFEKETLGFYVSGHPLNKYSEELRMFSSANTESLYRFVDETVNIGGIVSQMKRSKIKKGPNEGKLMAKFILDDQFGSVDVVVFSDLYSKYAKWLDNGVAILLTAAVKDTGGMSAGRSASLQSAEQNAHRIDDEYGGHPEERPRISAYEIREDEVEDDRDPKEIEREKYGDRQDNLGLFGGAAVSAAAVVEDEIIAGEDTGAPAGTEEPSFASHAAAFSETPITPELNALEMIPLDGIRDRKVKEIALEVPYVRMSDETVRKIREIVEEHSGEIPVTVTIVELPQEIAANAGSNALRLKINHHFRVQPGPALNTALQQVHASPRYVF